MPAQIPSIKDVDTSGKCRVLIARDVLKEEKIG
jgi:hypothetical protein